MQRKKKKKEKKSPLVPEELQNFRKQDFSDAKYKTKTKHLPTSSTTRNIEPPYWNLLHITLSDT